MVERMLSMHEAQGSIPWFSTLFLVLFHYTGRRIIEIEVRFFWGFCLMTRRLATAGV
jgi:hypothetical protein